MLPCTVVEGGCGRMEGTSLICILFRWLVLVGSCRYGIFFSPPELKPRCQANRHTHPHHSKILFIALQSALLMPHTQQSLTVNNAKTVFNLNLLAIIHFHPEFICLPTSSHTHTQTSTLNNKRFHRKQQESAVLLI